MSNENKLITKPIPGLIAQIAIPSSVGFLFNTLYNLVDTYYSGKISTEALAAVSLSFPVFFIIIALGVGISTGATALIGNALGANQKTEARWYATQAVSFSFILSILITIVGLAIAPWLFTLLGASQTYLGLSLSYINVIFYGTVFFMANFILNAILTAGGDTKTYRNWLIVGFFLNVVFDPWFMYGGYGLPALGLAGVAWATVVIQAITAFALWFKVKKSEIFCTECFNMLKPKKFYFLELTKQGFPSSLNMMTVAIGIFVITYFVGKFGHAAVAAYGIATRLDQLALLPSSGFNVATLTLVSQNNGAKLFDRVKKTITLGITYGLMVNTVSIIVIGLFARPLMQLFTSDQVVINTGVHYLYISILLYWAYGLLYITVSALQGLKYPQFAVFIGLYRQIIAPIIIFWLLATVFGWGIYGIWWGIFAINWSAALISFGYLRNRLKKI
ncbi:MAG: MATE family efflux transporter [Candidatus Falkowbacteria bacterium]